jgi:ElaB/YqjD/DUF883 family membrane-anchored ribosome-binding protein
MAKKSNVNNLSDAIDELERFASSKTSDIKSVLEDEMHDLKKKLEDLKPIFEKFKETVSDEAVHAKRKVEEKVKEHPYAAIGILAFIALLVGFVLASSRKSD